MGRRLGELTQNNTKCMVRVNGVPLIDRMLSQLSHANLSRVIIVVGYQGQKLINHIGDRYDDKLKIVYINNPIYDKTNNIYSLALTKDLLVEEDTLLLESDLIFEDNLLDMVIDAPHPNVALVSKYETWMDGTMVRIDQDCNIINFIPKKGFKYEDVDDYYKTVNIYKFSKEFLRSQYVPFLEAYSKAMGNNEYYEQVLRIITALDKTDLRAIPVGKGKWYEIDDIQDLDIAEALFAHEDEKLAKYFKRYGGYWRFPHLLDFCYLVNPYFPTKRMKDEMKANFDILLTEYPSGMGVNSLLAGKYFNISSEYVVVGNGAAELIKALMEHQTEGKVGFVWPTFEEYPNRLEPERRVVFTPGNPDFSYTAADLMKYFDDKEISTLLLVNPDNPSGNFIPFPHLLELIEWCGEKGIRLVVDESFVDFTDDFSHNTLLRNKTLESYPHLVVVKSISKSYGVPGLRLGIVASSDKERISRMKKDVAIWNINSFAEFYMQIFSKYESAYKDACVAFIRERERFAKELAQVPYLRVVPSQANYFLCEVTEGVTSHELTRRLLLEHSILIKDCSTKKGFGGKNYVRIAIRDRKDNQSLIAALL